MTKQVSFDRSLYLPEAVEAAALAYAPHAEITLTPTDNGVLAVISGVREHDPEVVVNAFCNHALHETIVRLRHAALR
jgi:hypothetical protein